MAKQSSGRAPRSEPTAGSRRLEAVILEVTDLEKSEVLYREGFGLPLHLGDNGVEDRWIGGRHAEISWTDGAYIHFALYPAPQQPTSRTQLTFTVDDIDDAHATAVAAGAQVIHEPRSEPWGRSGRYEDFDGNIIELTQRPSGPSGQPGHGQS